MTAKLEMFVRFTDGRGVTRLTVEDTPENRRALDREAWHFAAKSNVASIDVAIKTGRTAGYDRSRGNFR